MLASNHCSEREAPLDAALHAPARLPEPIPPGEQRVPSGGLGSRFVMSGRSECEEQEHVVLQMLAQSSRLAALLVGQQGDVVAYARARAARALRARFPDPVGSLAPDDAWLEVQSEVLEGAAASTLTELREWSASVTEELGQEQELAGCELVGSVVAVLELPPVLAPGETAAARALGWEFQVKDYGELLSELGGDVVERCKCLFLAVGNAVGVDPAVLLSAVRRQARALQASVGAPLTGSHFESTLHGLELAHDALERDHAQMRAMLVWFAHEVLAEREIVFLCDVDGELRIEVLTGVRFDGCSERRGWVLVARHHAQEIREFPVSRAELEAKLVAETGRNSDAFVLAGHVAMLKCFAQRRERKMGCDSLRAVDSLHVCEFCPSKDAPRVRCVARRFLSSAASAGQASEGGAAEFPTAWTLSGAVSSSSAMGARCLDASRSAIRVACEAVFLGGGSPPGAPPGFLFGRGAGGHVGGSGEAARAEFVCRDHLSFTGSVHQPFRLGVKGFVAGDGLVSISKDDAVSFHCGAAEGAADGVAGVERASPRDPGEELLGLQKAAVYEVESKLGVEWTMEAAAALLVELWTEFPKEQEWEVKSARIASIEWLTNAMAVKAIDGGGSHVDVAKAFNRSMRGRFGHHLSVERISEVPGLTKEVRDMLISVATQGVGEHVVEQGPRTHLRLKMDDTVATLHGRQAIEKMVEDGRHGRVLLLSSVIEEWLKKDPKYLMVCKMIRVAKRFLSGAVNPNDARFCNSQLDANKLVPSKGVGPGGGVKLPTILDVCRLILRIAHMYPGLPVLLSKYDVNSAFKLVPLMEELIGLFAASIPRWCADLGAKGNLYVVSLVLTFGSTISPGYFDFFSKAISHAQRHFAPSCPERDGTAAFSNEMLVDDLVMVEALLGDRLREAAAVSRWLMRMLLGWDAVNEVKGAEEAMFEINKIVWGLTVDATAVPVNPLALLVELPPVKREKAATLVFDERFNWGSFNSGRWQAQVLGGNMIFWSNICVMMWPLMRRLASSVMALPDGTEGPSEPSAAELVAYSELWAVVELLRIVVGSQQWWSTTFSGSVGSLMGLEERMQFEPEELVWLGGDANMNGVAGVSWSDGVYYVFRTADWADKLKESVRAFQMREVSDDVIIAIWELMCFVVLATNCAANWQNRTVLYVSDNMLVQGWLETMHSTNPLVNWLLSLVGLSTIRFRFGLYSVYIDTEANPCDQPSRCFDPDDVRKSDCPSEAELEEYMRVHFPGCVRRNGDAALEYYLRPGGVTRAFELFGMPDPMAVQLASARGDRGGQRVRPPRVAVGFFSGVCALERVWIALGNQIRAVGEWSAASRAVARLELGALEYFSDVTGDDHKHVANKNVTSAFITASCVDYSLAGEQLGLNGRRAWQIVDMPRKLLHFTHLLATLVENVHGWLTANDGQAFAFYATAMRRLRHQVHDPVRLNSRVLGEAIQSDRVMVLTSREEFKGHVASPAKMASKRRPAVPLSRKLLPIGEVMRRRGECEVLVEPGTWQGCTVSSTHAYGPVKLGSYVFRSVDADGLPAEGALVRFANSSELWRVVQRFGGGGDGSVVRAKLRSGAKKLFKPLAGAVVEPFRVAVYSTRGQAFRVTASEVAEPPLRQSKAAYWEDRGDGMGFVRILLAEEGWFAMGKSADVLQRWKERATLEAANAQLPRTVPPFTAAAIWSVVGNSIVHQMAKVAVTELSEMVEVMQGLLDDGSVKLEPVAVKTEDELYDEAARRFRRMTFARQSYQGAEPDNGGIDDSHLNVARRAKDDDDGATSSEHVGLLLGGAKATYAARAHSEACRASVVASAVASSTRSAEFASETAGNVSEEPGSETIGHDQLDQVAEMMERAARGAHACGGLIGARRSSRARVQRELLRPDHVAASKSVYGTAAAGDSEAPNTVCTSCEEPFFSASGKSVLCLQCRNDPIDSIVEEPARVLEQPARPSASTASRPRVPIPAAQVVSKKGGSQAFQAHGRAALRVSVGEDGQVPDDRVAEPPELCSEPRVECAVVDDSAAFGHPAKRGSAADDDVSESVRKAARVHAQGLREREVELAARASGSVFAGRAAAPRAPSVAQRADRASAATQPESRYDLDQRVEWGGPPAGMLASLAEQRGVDEEQRGADEDVVDPEMPGLVPVRRPVFGPPQAFGPPRPPAQRKVATKKRKDARKGLSLLGMEAEKAMLDGDYRAFEDFANNVVPLHSVAFSTLKAYESGWKKWVSFQFRALRPIFLPMGTIAEQAESSRWVLTFMSVSAFCAGFAAGTIKGDLMALRFFHLAHGHVNPLDALPRVWQAYRAIKRISAPTQRKHPTTHAMHRWLNERDGREGTWDACVRIAARMHGVYLGCRSSEYLGGPPADWSKLCLVRDIVPMAGTRFTDWSDSNVDGYMRTFRASKTDQYNEGCRRFCGATGTDLCSVQAFKDMYAACPAHFDRPDAGMFTLSNGKVLERKVMQDELRASAVAAGLDPKRIGTHSLRVTCACWLYHSGHDIGYIKRHGRWISDVVHVYLWEGDGKRGVAEQMAKADFQLHVHL